MQWWVEIERNFSSSDPRRYSRWGRIHSFTFCPKSSTILRGSTFQHFESSLQCWTNSDEARSTCCTSTLTRAASYFIINARISLNWSGCSPLSSAVSLVAAAHRTFALIFAWPLIRHPGQFTLWHNAAEIKVPLCLSLLEIYEAIAYRSMFPLCIRFSITVSSQMLGQLSST